jgi:glycogen synthase
MGLKILHVLDHSVPLQSGYSFRTLAILREQRRLGLETVQVTSSKHHGAEADEESVDGFRFFRTRPTRSLLRRLPVAGQLMVVIDLAQRIEQVVSRTQPDLLHAHSPALNGLAAMRVARKLNLPLVYEMRASWEDAAVDHGTTSSGSVRYRLSRALETRVFQRADAITTICEGLLRDIVVRGVPREQVTVIPNAVDLGDFPVIETPDSKLREQIGLRRGPVLGFVGSFYGYEGLDLLLSTVPALVQTHPDLEVLLVGGGPAEPALKQQAAELCIVNRVRFVGRVQHAEVPRYYSLIDVLVYPRKSIRLTETVTPLKPLEAMAQGRLFVASDVGGHRELVPQALHGHLFRAGDRTDLVRVLSELLSDRAGWARAIGEGRRHVDTHRTWQKSVQGYPQVYAAAIAHHDSSRPRARAFRGLT